MVDVTLTIGIARTVEEVFAYLSDMTNEPSWHTDALKVTKTSDGEIGKGTIFHMNLKPSMGISEGDAEVIEFELNRSQTTYSDLGTMRPTVTNAVQPMDGGTLVTRRIRVETTGFMMWLMRPVMGMMVKRRNRQFLANLKRVLEDG